MMGWLEIKQRYRRSVLGPFWITLSMAALIGGMGPLYGRLFGQDLSTYFAYLAVGVVTWMLVSSLVTEGCNCLISAEPYITQTNLPISIHVLRTVWKNLIMFAHNFVVVIIVLLYYRPSMGWSALLVPVALLFVVLNGLWIGLVLGLLCVRFRDIPPTVTSAIQVVFFLTPVMWRPDMLKDQRWVADINPLFHLVEIVRAPLIGYGFPYASWIAVIGMTIGGSVLAVWLFSRYRTRIAYWV